MVERGDQLDLARQQHTVAEYVTCHIADADNGERVCLSVQAHLTEVAFDGFPGAACRDAHLLVVVAR